MWLDLSETDSRAALATSRVPTSDLRSCQNCPSCDGKNWANFLADSTQPAACTSKPKVTFDRSLNFPGSLQEQLRTPSLRLASPTSHRIVSSAVSNVPAPLGNSEKMWAFVRTPNGASNNLSSRRALEELSDKAPQRTAQDKQKQSRPPAEGPGRKVCYKEMPDASSIVPLINRAVLEPQAIQDLNFVLFAPIPAPPGIEVGFGEVYSPTEEVPAILDPVGGELLPAKTIRLAPSHHVMNMMAATIGETLQFLAEDLGYYRIAMRMITGRQIDDAFGLYARHNYIDMHSTIFADDRRPRPPVRWNHGGSQMREEARRAALQLQYPQALFAVIEVIPGCLWPIESRWFSPETIGAYQNESQALLFNNEYSGWDWQTSLLPRVASGSSIGVCHELFHAVQKAEAPQFWSWAHERGGPELTEWLIEGSATAIAVAAWARKSGHDPTFVSRTLDAFIGRRGGRQAVRLADDPLAFFDRDIPGRISLPAAIDLPVQGYFDGLNSRYDVYGKGILFFCANEGNVGYIQALFRELEARMDRIRGQSLDEFYSTVDSILAGGNGLPVLNPPYVTSDGDRLTGLRAAYLRAVLGAAHQSVFYTDDENGRLSAQHRLTARVSRVCAGGGEADESCGLGVRVDDHPELNFVPSMAHQCRSFVASEDVRDGTGQLEFSNMTEGNVQLYMVLQGLDRNVPPVVTRIRNRRFSVPGLRSFTPISMSVVNLDFLRVSATYQVLVNQIRR